MYSKRPVRYVCAHASCNKVYKDTVITWFELLAHAWAYHCTRPILALAEDLVGMVRDEDDKILTEKVPNSLPSLHFDYRHELAYVLNILHGALRKSSIDLVIPQLMYELYYSRKILFADAVQSREIQKRMDRQH